eukprot:7930786-Lingulodinium_polyedra.AAC.1
MLRRRQSCRPSCPCWKSRRSRAAAPSGMRPRSGARWRATPPAGGPARPVCEATSSGGRRSYRPATAA